MPNYAVVIGIDQFNDPSLPSLTNPVDGAMRMAAWLLTPGPAGGNVPLANLFLLVNPIPPTIPAPPGVDLDRLQKLGQLKPATQLAIRKAVVEMNRRAEVNGIAERLYFYCSSHGLQVKVSPFSDVEYGFVSADYDPQGLAPLSELSIRKLYKRGQFSKQFFFYDFCRNQAFRVGALDQVTPQQRGQNEPPPPDPPRDLEQFVFLATPPGAVAIDDKGLLTDSLLDGLHGIGAAKLFVLAGNVPQYEVHADRLISFISERMAAKHAAISGPGEPLQFQTPRLDGEHADSKLMTIATLPESAVQPVTLSLTVDPKEPWGITSIDLFGDGPKEFNQPKIDNVPLTFAVPPRQYAVVVKAPGWTRATGQSIQEIYEDTALAVTLVRATPNPAPPAPQPPAPSFGMAPAPSLGPPAVATGVKATTKGPGWISIRSNDPLIPAELRNSAGEPVAGGKPTGKDGEQVWTDLAPGFYLACLRAPNGSVAEQQIHLTPGEHLPVSLSVPQMQKTPAMATVLAMANDPSPSPRRIGGRRRVGPLGMREDTQDSDDPPKLPFGPATSPQPQVEILIAVDESSSVSGLQPASGTQADRSAKVQNDLRNLAFRLWPLDGEPPGALGRATLAATPGVATYSVPASPGAYWLEVQVGADWPLTRFAVNVLDGRTARFVFHQEASGHIRVYHCQPALRQDLPNDADRSRRYDLAQQYVMNGEIQQGLAIARALVEAATPGPLDLSLLGYLLIRTVADSTRDELRRVAEQAVRLYPSWPDAHVLAAVVAEKPEDIQANMVRALDAGLPSMAPLFERLAAWVDKWKLKHKRADMVSHVAEGLVPGLLWTAWTVPTTKVP